MIWRNSCKQLLISIHNGHSGTEGTNISISESTNFHFKFQWHTERILFLTCFPKNHDSDIAPLSKSNKKQVLPTWVKVCLPVSTCWRGISKIALLCLPPNSTEMPWHQSHPPGKLIFNALSEDMHVFSKACTLQCLLLILSINPPLSYFCPMRGTLKMKYWIWKLPTVTWYGFAFVPKVTWETNIFKVLQGKDIRNHAFQSVRKCNSRNSHPRYSKTDFTAFPVRDMFWSSYGKIK